MNERVGKIDFNGIGALFGDSRTQPDDQAAGRDAVTELPTDRIVGFKNHPYRVADDDAMKELILSVSENGVVTPVIVRPAGDGKYELISGHRRVFACERAGKNTIPAVIRECGDDEATVLMVDSNLQRPKFLPSEMAKALAMKKDALGRMGRTEPLAGISRKQMYRFLKLNTLPKELLDAVDSGRLSVSSGANVAELSADEQAEVMQYLQYPDKHSITARMSEKMLKDRGTGTTVTAGYLLRLESEEEDRVEKLSFGRTIRSYFPAGTSTEVMEAELITLLERRKREDDA